MNKNSKSLPQQNKYQLILLLFIIAIALSLLFYFLPINTELQENKKTNIYFADNITPAHEQIIANFNNKYAEDFQILPVDLPFTKFNTDERKELLARTLRNRNNRIDIFAVDQIWMHRFAKWAEPLSRYFSKAELSEILPQARETCFQDNILFGIPLHVDIGLMYYRKDILSKFPNWESIEIKIKSSISWDEFIELNSKYNEGKPSYIFQGDSYEGLFVNILELFAGYGEQFIVNGEINILHPAFKKSCQHLHDLIIKSKQSPLDVTKFNESAGYRYAFLNDVPFFRGWPSLLQEIEDYPEAVHVKNNLGLAPLPHFKEHPSVSIIGGWNLMVSQNSAKKNQAIKFLKYILSTEGQEILMKTAGYLPVKTKMYEIEKYQKYNPYLPKFKELLGKGVHRPTHAEYTQISSIITPYIHMALIGELTIDEALKKAIYELKENNFSLIDTSKRDE
jgi:ABC-type glycerol-3-phosphate transport system substrate-binding protein